MDLLSGYLAKYRTLTPPQSTKAKLIAQVIRDECGIDVAHTDIQVRRGGATLSVHPTVRCEVGRHIPRVLTVLHQQHNTRLSFLR